MQLQTVYIQPRQQVTQPILKYWRRINKLSACFLISLGLQAQVCHKWDWKHAHEVQVPCKAPSKLMPKNAVVKNTTHFLGQAAFWVGAVVVAGGLLYVAALSPSGVKVK